MVAMNASKRRNGGSHQVVSRVREGASEALHYVRDQTAAATQQAKESATEVANAILETVQDEAERFYGRHKKRAVSKVSGLGKVAKQTAHALHAVKADAAAEYLDEASRRVRQASQYLEEQSLSEILQDAGDVVRRNSALTAGALFLVGFATVRFLKATELRSDDEEADDSGNMEAEGDSDDSEDDPKDDAAPASPRGRSRRGNRD